MAHLTPPEFSSSPLGGGEFGGEAVIKESGLFEWKATHIPVTPN
jgi:hypothetical protein